MANDDRVMWRKNCDDLGISWARAAVCDVGPGIERHVREWIDEYDRAEASKRDESQRVLAQAAVDAAQLSAETSAAAAEASKKSALWTMVAAIVAAISTLVTAAVAFAQFKGWMPK